MRPVGELRSPRNGGGVAGELRQLAREMVEIVHHVGGARANALREVVGGRVRRDLGCGRSRLALGQRREKVVELRRAGRAQRSGARSGAGAVARGGARWGWGAAGARQWVRQWARRRVRLGRERVWHGESRGRAHERGGAGKWAGVATDN